MADPSRESCVFCETPIARGELAVFRDGVKRGHVRCWRPDDRTVPSPPVGPAATTP